MKKLILFFAMAVLAFMGCEKTEHGDSGEKVRLLTIASERPLQYETTDTIINGKFTSANYIYKENGSDWQLWYDCYPIEGFELKNYKSGFEYEIRIVETPLLDSAMGKASVSYKLQEIVSKVEKNSEGLPDWMIDVVPFEKIFTIASVKPVVYEWTTGDYAPGYSSPEYIYKEDNDDWGIWWGDTPIVGLDEVYEEGYEYVIRVLVEKSPYADMADASLYAFRFSEVVSKAKKDSEGVPEWMYTLPTQRTLAIASARPKNKEYPYFYSSKNSNGSWMAWKTWSWPNIIQGFDDIYEEGYEYVIRVNILYVDDKPYDRFKRRYELDAILSKEKKDTPDLPEY